MARDQALRKTPPPDRRCHARVVDPRSKNFGGDCPNFAVKGRELCAAHAGIPQAAYARSLEARAILGSSVPEDVAARENELSNEQAEESRQFHERQAEKLREHQRRREQKREERRLALATPKAPEGWIHVRRYDVPDWQRPHALVDEDGRPFRWHLVRLDEHVQREREDMVNDWMAPREAVINAKLAPIRERLKRRQRMLSFDPLHPAHRRGAPRDPLESELERYEGVPVDLSPEALGLR